MKFTANRSELYKLLSKISKVAKDSHIIEILRGVCIEAFDDRNEMRFIGTDIDSAIVLKMKAEVKNPGKIVVNAKMIAAIVDKMPGETLEISCEGRYLCFQSEKSLIKINYLLADGYPPVMIPFPKDTILIKDIKGIVKKSLFANTSEQKTPVLSSVHLTVQGENSFLSTVNTGSVAVTKALAEYNGKKEISIPLSPLKTLAEISDEKDEFRVGFFSNELVFMNSTILYSIKLVKDNTFFHATKVFSSVTPKYKATILAKDMLDALESINVCRTNYMTLIINENNIKVSCESEIASTHQKIKANVKVPMKGIEFTYKINNLIKIFNTVGKSPAIIEVSDSGFMLIKSSNEFFLESPIVKKISKVEKKSA